MRVVVVDDEKKMRDEIADYLKTFEKEQKVLFPIPLTEAVSQSMGYRR